MKEKNQKPAIELTAAYRIRILDHEEEYPVQIQLDHAMIRTGNCGKSVAHQLKDHAEAIQRLIETRIQNPWATIDRGISRTGNWDSDVTEVTEEEIREFMEKFGLHAADFPRDRKQPS